MPTRSAFFDPEEKPSASVVVELRPGDNLSSDQTRGIVRLVAASVPGLTPQKVTVVDTSGRLLTFADGPGEISESDHLHRLKSLYEKELESRIQTMLEPVLGPGRAITRASVQLNFQEIEQTREEFDPSGQIVRSQQQTSEGPSAAAGAAGGVPGVQSNIPGGDGKKAAETAKPSGIARSNQVISYEVGRTMSRISEPRGQLQRLSVAVLVDGKYTNGAYSPRSKEELEALKTMVMRAVGFDEERGDQIEVVNFPIQGASPAKTEDVRTPEFTQWLHSPAMIGAGAASLLFLFLLGVLFGKRKRSKMLLKQAPLQQLPVAPGKVGNQNISGELKKVEVVSDPRREQLVEIARDYHEMSVRLLRSWLTEEDRKRGFAEGRPSEET